MCRISPLGPHRSHSLGSGGCGGGDVFEFERDHVHVGGEAADGVEIVVGRVDFHVGDLAGGRVFVGRERVDPIAHAAGGDGEHAAQLAAAQDADGRAGEDRVHSSCLFDYFALLRCAEVVQLGAQSGRVLARIATAKSAAFFAPAVADGERCDGNAGGHLHDREQRIHAVQDAAFDGHAQHGHDGVSGGHARQMRGAARAGDDHFDAARFGGRGEFGHQLRRAVRGDDAAFVRDAEFRE